MRQTTNYQLPSWDSEDRILRTDFNELTEKTDAALKGNADAISSEASTRSSAINTLTNALTQKGNCRVQVQTYVGTGKSGSSNKNSVTFEKLPLLFFIAGSDLNMGYCTRGSAKLWTRYGNTTGYSHGTWSGTTYSWSESDEHQQMNEAGVTYTVVAFLSCDE